MKDVQHTARLAQCGKERPFTLWSRPPLSSCHAGTLSYFYSRLKSPEVLQYNFVIPSSSLCFTRTLGVTVLHCGHHVPETFGPQLLSPSLCALLHSTFHPSVSVLSTGDIFSLLHGTAASQLQGATSH